MKKLGILIVSIFLIATDLLASNIWGSEITYRPLATGSSQYEITVIYYRNCGGVPASASSMTVRAKCAGGSASTQLSMTLVRAVDVTSLSAASGECTPSNTYGTGQGVEALYFLDTIDFGSAPFSAYASCGETIIEMDVCCRNTNQTTVTSNANFYNYASIFFSNFSANTSSSAGLKPLCKAMTNKPVRYYNTQINPDNDSLSFQLVNPLSAADTAINYTSGYAADIPVKVFYFAGYSYPYSNPNYATPLGSYFNKNNGDWVFTPVNNENSFYVIEVTEWRKDANGTMKKAGITRKDMNLEIRTYGGYQLFENIALNTSSCIGESNKLTLEAKDDKLSAVSAKNADSLVVEVISDYPVVYTQDSMKLSSGTRVFGSLNWHTDSFSAVPPSFEVIVRLHSGKFANLPLFDSRRITINNYPRPQLSTSINKLSCGMTEISASMDTFNSLETIVSYTVLDTGFNTLKTGYLSSTVAKDTFLLSVAGTYYVETISSYALSCETRVLDTVTLSSADIYPLPSDTAYLACYVPSKTLAIDSKWKQGIWSTGDTAHSISVDTAGTYTVQLSDSCGNSFTHVFKVAFRSYHPTLSDAEVCINVPVNYTINPLSKMSWKWPNGSNSSSYTATTSGLKILNIYDSLCNYTFADTFVIAYKNKAVANIPRASDIRCDENEVLAEAVFNPDYTYKWSTGSDSSATRIFGPGWFTVTVSNACGSSQDSIFIIQRYSPAIDLGKDLILCEGDSVTIGVIKNANYTYKWEDGLTDFTRLVKTENQYILTATNGCGATPDTLQVYVIDAPSVDLGPDTAIWEFDIINLKNRTPSRFATYKWSIGSEADNLDVKLAGTYWLTETNACGSDRDSLVLRYKLSVLEPGEMGVSLYPNPTKSILTVERASGEGALLSIYSTLGALVWEQQIEGLKSMLDVNTLVSGTYIIRIKQSSSISVHKIHKE